MFPYFSFFLGDQLPGSRLPNFGRGRQLRAGHRRYNFGWYRVADSRQVETDVCRHDEPEPGHKIYSYLLRGVEITRPNQHHFTTPRSAG